MLPSIPPKSTNTVFGRIFVTFPLTHEPSLSSENASSLRRFDSFSSYSRIESSSSFPEGLTFTQARTFSPTFTTSVG